MCRVRTNVIHHSVCNIFWLTQNILKELKAFISDTENSKSQDSLAPESTEEKNKSHDAPEPEPPEDPPSKRAKLEPTGSDAATEEDAVAAAAEAAVKLEDEEPHVCVVCLGILQELCDSTQAVKVCVLENTQSFHNNIHHDNCCVWLCSCWAELCCLVVFSQIAEAVKAQNYEFDTLVLSVSLPAQLCVREVRVCLCAFDLANSLVIAIINMLISFPIYWIIICSVKYHIFLKNGNHSFQKPSVKSSNCLFGSINSPKPKEIQFIKMKN